MITIWISASLLAITGWQGYRLGKDYGWWGSPQPARPQPTAHPAGDANESAIAGLGQTKTDVNKLLQNWKPATAGHSESVGEGHDDTADTDEQSVTMPATTLQQLNESTLQDYPEETDQIPQTCSWLDDEAIPLVSSDAEEVREPVVPITEYVKRVRTVQQKMAQLAKRRTGDNTFMKQELGMLIDTYNLGNDQSLDWLFQQQKQAGLPDYGALFDELENNAA